MVRDDINYINYFFVMREYFARLGISKTFVTDNGLPKVQIMYKKIKHIFITL